MPEEAAATPLLAGVKVLRVDDTTDSLEVVMVMLRVHGAAVTGAASVDEAIEILQRDRPDVLVRDVGMPGNGLSLIRRVRALPRESGGETPAAALTAFTSPDDQTQALPAGFHVHIPKPVEPTQLAMGIAALVGRSAQSPPS